MKRDSFIFYRSFYEGLKNIPDADRLQCYDAIVRYGLDGEEQAEGIAAAVLALVRPVIDSNNQRFVNGSKGGRPKTKTEPNKNQTITKPKPNNNQTETEPKPNPNLMRNVYVDVNEKKEKEREKEKEKTKPKPPPTVEQVKEYAAKAGLNLDAERFVDYYTANGWKVGGRTPMKDWQAAARNWARRDKPKTSKGFDYENQRNYTADDYAALERRLLAR